MSKIQVVFKNLKHSDILRDIVTEKLSTVVDKFPDFENQPVTVTLSMENSPRQAGPDLFSVKFISKGKKLGSLIQQRSSTNLYVAVAELADSLIETIGRHRERIRWKSRTNALALSY
ncbi:MAG: HPF/RaiA family ribosome-associated protein [Oligoflexia bacterium]|nr:HPF/RaiA family ribosome-associated protein [Oligoflexia bacterium]MBF0366676.1 HPF/RaiA family ribosome-associated protein [Oligoflexia bacterium]